MEINNAVTPVHEAHTPGAEVWKIEAEVDVATEITEIASTTRSKHTKKAK